MDLYKEYVKVSETSRTAQKEHRAAIQSVTGRNYHCLQRIASGKQRKVADTNIIKYTATVSEMKQQTLKYLQIKYCLKLDSSSM